MGAGGPRGATPHSRSGGVAVKRCPHVQGKTHLSKMVAVARGHQRADTETIIIEN